MSDPRHQQANKGSNLSRRKQTFMERFAKTYDYPYGNSYLSSYLYEPGKEIMENSMFERII